MRRRRNLLASVICIVLFAAVPLSSCAILNKAPASPSPAAFELITPAGDDFAAPQQAAAGSDDYGETDTSPGPEALPENTASALDEMRALMDQGRYYEVFREILKFEETCEDPLELSACEALFEELDLQLRALEPESGTELERGFTVQGGGVLEVNAFSGPVIVTVADINAGLQPELASHFVRFYVRQGEYGETHLPAGSYRVSYQVGYRWFGGDIGFGEFCAAGTLEDPLDFDFYMDGPWANNAKYTITL